MEWFVHIGTEKTGSSYLQSMLARARAALEKEGTAFPPGWRHDERSMRNGRISAGNSRLLARALNCDDTRTARNSLQQAEQSARRVGAGRVLLASEWLLSALSKPSGLHRLMSLLEEQKATRVSFLLVLRDPLEQCLSLYKHRAKRGTAGDIQTWLTDGYALPRDLKSLRAQIDDPRLEMTVRQYDRRPGAMQRMFFEDWLGIAVPQVNVRSSVNPSLTLSELILIQQMAATQPKLVGPLEQALSDVPAADKAQEEPLEEFARAVATQTVAAYSGEWAAWNERLRADEQLSVPDAPPNIPRRPQEAMLSERQMGAICAFTDNAATISFITSLFWRSRVRPTLGRIKRIIWRNS